MLVSHFSTSTVGTAQSENWTVLMILYLQVIQVHVKLSVAMLKGLFLLCRKFVSLVDLISSRFGCLAFSTQPRVHPCVSPNTLQSLLGTNWENSLPIELDCCILKYSDTFVHSTIWCATLCYVQEDLPFVWHSITAMWSQLCRKCSFS